MGDTMKTYRKPDGYTIQATPKAFQLFYKKQGFVPVEDEENIGSGEQPAKAEADRQEEPEENSSAEAPEENSSAEAPEENSSAEASEENSSAETPEENSSAETPEENSSAETPGENTSIETLAANDREPEAAKPSTKRKSAAGKKADSASEQPAG